MSRIQRKKGPPSTLRIDMPHQSSLNVIALGDPTSSTPATSDSDFTSSPRPRSLRNMKKLSLNLPSAQSSSLSLGALPEPQSAHSSAQPELPAVPRPRRPSVISLPPASANSTVVSLLHRKEEEGDGDVAVPYADGPTQIIPGIWLGSEENARDWNSLISRGIRSILNVAKEVASPFDSATNSQSLRSVVSTPNLNKPAKSDATYHPPNPATGRPGLHYLKLQWSHGQQNLVTDGFPAAMAFTDEALQRGDGVLIHCQCGISRSATLVIALVMRAAAERSPSVPAEIWALKGMQPAYDYVKQKSKWVGPNMSLIYQLLDYEHRLKGSDPNSPSSDRSSLLAEEEAEWSRKRRMLDEMPSDEDEDEENESRLVLQEAQALDKAMEERIVARKASASSLVSHGSSTGVGMGTAWRSRYSRKRTGSTASNVTNGSVISEDLVEEEEEQELLGVGGGFESDGREQDREGEIRDRASVDRDDHSSFASAPSSAKNSPEDDENTVYVADQSSNLPSTSTTFSPYTPKTARPRPRALAQRESRGALPPSAPVWKTSFGSASLSLPPPATAFRPTFNLSSTKSHKRRPPPLGMLPPVPPSPIAIVVDGESSSEAEASGSELEVEAKVPLSPQSKRSRSTRSSVHSPDAVSVSSTSSRSHSRRSFTSIPSHPSPASLPAPTRPVVPSIRLRTESRKPAPPPLHLRNSIVQRAKEQEQTHSAGAMLSKVNLNPPRFQVATPSQSQTLFVFPPSPTLTTRTPSTMTLMSATTPLAPGVPFPIYSATPRVSTFRGAHGKTRSFIGLGAPPTPTTAFSRVDARGYVGLE